MKIRKKQIMFLIIFISFALTDVVYAETATSMAAAASAA